MTYFNYLDPGIINNNSEFQSIQPPTNAPTENAEPIQESTLQLPFGDHSILSELLMGSITPIQAMIVLTFCYRSNWRTGNTWRTSQKELAKLMGVSTRYIRDTIKSTPEWIQVRTANKGNVATTYQITHHNCSIDEVPTDKDGEPLSFAVPRGLKGIFEMMFAGDIHWKTALTWIVLKLKSDWTTGITDALNMETLAKLLKMSKSTACQAIRSLTNQGLLKRLSKVYECSVFQLIPKPYKERKQRTKRRKQKRQADTMRREGEFCYSLNELYRVNVETGKIEHRATKDKGLWKGITDYHRADKMPKRILEDFDKVRIAYFSLKSTLGSTDNAQGSIDNAQGSIDNAQGNFEKVDEPLPPLTLNTS